MTQKNRTLEGKNWTLGGREGSKIVENLCTFPYWNLLKNRVSEIWERT